MQSLVYEKRSRLDVPGPVAFAWHRRPGAFERLNPPWERGEILAWTGGIENGASADLRIYNGPFALNWSLIHQNYQEGVQFQDVQLRGPFSGWAHTHRMEPLDEQHCDLVDHIEYRLPLHGIAKIFAGRLVRKKLERMFRYRHRITATDLQLHKPYLERAPMRVAITGASGLIGSALAPFLSTGGHSTIKLVRRKPIGSKSEVYWNPATGELDASPLKGVQAVVHLAGENIAGARWTPETKNRILESRVTGTRSLCEALASLPEPPKVLVAASAIGFYGNRGDDRLTEASDSGEGFLPEVCRLWEAATGPARDAGIRVVNLRIGIVLASQGGALAKMLPPFKLGLGGVVGNGRQYMSWIALDDLIGAIHHCLMNDGVQGAVNATAPEPSTNRDFTRTLGRVLHRPTPFPVPGLVIRTLFGEMADALLLGGCRVEPRKLLDSGYTFQYPQLDSALRHMLGL